MSPSLYAPIYFYCITLICIVFGIKYYVSNGYVLQQRWNGSYNAFAICAVIAIWLGLRPISGYYFGDTYNYALVYEITDTTLSTIDWHGEFLWEMLMRSCKAMGLTVRVFFLIVEVCYFMVTFWVVKRIMPSHVMLGMLFFLSSLMFYSFGINGIRNGIACQIILLSISYVIERRYVISLLLLFISFSIHRSVLLPFAACICAMYFIKQPRVAVYIWLFSILISLLVGSYFEDFILSLDLDDRLVAYNADNVDMEQFSHTSFRWDFLLYSAAAVYMIWHVCIRAQASDLVYEIMSITYLLSNAFWVLLIRIPFSNRFAFLSWCIMPLIIAYPLINLAVWEKQDSMIGLILIAWTLFTLGMQFVWGYI